jgi:predicted negative regulator of RcsB-dependent stress response
MTQTASAENLIQSDSQSSPSTGSNLMDWALENKGALLALVLAVLALVGGWSGYKAYRLQQAKKASAALYEARKLGTESEAGTQALEKVSADFPGSHSAWEALMILGDAQAKKDPKSEAASTWYGKAESAATDAREKLLARYSQAYSLERQGKFEPAITQIESAQRLGLPHLKAELALNRARLLQLANKKEEALKAYDAVSADFANTDTARTAEQWKAEIK